MANGDRDRRDRGRGRDEGGRGRGDNQPRISPLEITGPRKNAAGVWEVVATTTVQPLNRNFFVRFLLDDHTYEDVRADDDTGRATSTIALPDELPHSVRAEIIGAGRSTAPKPVKGGSAATGAKTPAWAAAKLIEGANGAYVIHVYVNDADGKAAEGSRVHFTDRDNPAGEWVAVTKDGAATRAYRIGAADPMLKAEVEIPGVYHEDFFLAPARERRGGHWLLPAMLIAGIVLMIAGALTPAGSPALDRADQIRNIYLHGTTTTVESASFPFLSAVLWWGGVAGFVTAAFWAMGRAIANLGHVSTRVYNHIRNRRTEARIRLKTAATEEARKEAASAADKFEAAKTQWGPYLGVFIREFMAAMAAESFFGRR